MRVFLDYCTGPVLGHKRRCELLGDALRAGLGHKAAGSGV